MLASYLIIFLLATLSIPNGEASPRVREPYNDIHDYIRLHATLSYLPSGEADPALRDERSESNAYIGYHGIQNFCAIRCQNSKNEQCNICHPNS
ncbi:unnamed protein product [Gordionus sp. m RMFG-2023]